MKKKNYDVDLELEVDKVDKVADAEDSPWVVGEKYATHQDLYVWESAGHSKKDYDGENGIEDEFGKTMLTTGTIITVEDAIKIDDIWWIKTSFGYVCGKSPKISYVY